jgi:hypothetical protein
MFDLTQLHVGVVKAEAGARLLWSIYRLCGATAIGAKVRAGTAAALPPARLS